jgi:hypothetical protein
MRFTILAGLAAGLLALTPPAHAEDGVGRYQMVPLPARPGSFDNRVMILDTRDGHLWQWWEAPVVGGGNSGGRGIIYMGRVVPGSAAGENMPIPHSGINSPNSPSRN